jgi:hypothetical protein
MAESPGFLRYLSRAFNARPFGMVVPPNWIGLAAVGMLGVLNPGFWVIGAGLELGYLLLVSTNERFRRVVDAEARPGGSPDWTTKIGTALASLGRDERRRYDQLIERCRSIITLQSHGAPAVPAGLDAQQEGLGRLTWMYLRLLIARHTIENVLGQSSTESTTSLQRSMAALAQRLEGSVSDELRRSLEGQIEILKQRIERRGDADRQLAYIDAELARIEQQVELIREQAALSTDPELLSQRIDEITATLGGTSQWIRDQRQIFGAMEDLLGDPAPLPGPARAKESE